MHSLAGAVAYPGLYPNDDALDDAHTANMVLGKDGSTAQIHLKTDGTVHLGGENGAQFAARASDVTTQLNTLKSAISGAAVVANDGGAALKANIIAALSGWPGSVAASKVKIT